ncbi:hypothetical protein NKI56_32090 [Mesorhizobium sp. M0622]|uniref:hypothetical protein n=1 Tax=Mesorhizobium sp. M0622 TaxID=2956975 RepID=UPI0033367A03
MTENLRVGQIIHGQANVSPLQDGMRIEFGKSLTPVFDGDMLVVEMPHGEMTLHVIENLGDTIAVNGPGPNLASWNYGLGRLEGNLWLVRLEPHHKELLESAGRITARN